MTAPQSEDVNLSGVRRVDDPCTDFEAAWQAWRPPRLEDFLQRVDAADHAALLSELVRVELHYRRQQGEEPRLEEYLERFPQAASTLRELFTAGQALARRGSAFVQVSTPRVRTEASVRWPVVPGYEILGELGRGGMGVVNQAHHHGLQRLVALKMILAGDHAGTDALERFRIEAEAIARLQHPGIVQIFEIGQHDGLPFFAFEYCGGGSLAKKLAGTPLPPQEAAALLEQLAQAMSAAHAKNIIHRDLKPANILLSRVGGVFGTHQMTVVGSEDSTHPTRLLTPKITDFGLAKMLDSTPLAASTTLSQVPGVPATIGLTLSGAVIGTPSYMAPEQAQGRSSTLGPACDIHALGAILYECLTGRPPFKAATTLDTLWQVIYQEPVSPTQLNPLVPRDLETICLKCLRKEPAQRYATALDLAEDVRRFQRGEPIQARPVGTLEGLRKWARWRR